MTVLSKEMFFLVVRLSLMIRYFPRFESLVLRCWMFSDEQTSTRLSVATRLALKLAP